MSQRFTAKRPKRGEFVDYHRPKTGIEESIVCSALVTDDVDAANGVLGLTVFPPGVAPEPLAAVDFNPTGEPHTWRWGKS